MKTYRLAVISACLVFFTFVSVAQTSGPLVQFGKSYTLHSKILNQDRSYWVYLPPHQAYAHHRPQKYPVLYLLDGDWNFSWASEVVQFMSDSLQTPEMIVVGIPNTDREHDLSPTHDTNEISSGGGPLFEKFLSDELAPEINTKFPAAPYRILVGHSLGGALAADVFLRQTDGFQACIAIDPSLWWDNQVLVQRAREFTPGKNSQDTIYIASADWPRSLDPTNSMEGPAKLFVSILRTKASPGIRIGYQQLEAEDHSSSRLLGLYDGLRFTFDGYKPADPLVLGGPSLIRDHFEKLSGRLGFQVLPPEGLVNKIAFALLDAHETNNAVGCFQLNISNYPGSPYAYKNLGDVYLAGGEKKLAIQNYKKALKLNPDTDGVKEALAKLE
jgi:hypothetical protein